MANTKRQPTIGNGAGGSSYPNPSAGSTASTDPSLAVQYNGNANNFVEDPDVLNASPATKKSYSWNRGDTGNAT
jgi:hypothetical protein